VAFQSGETAIAIALTATAATAQMTDEAKAFLSDNGINEALIAQADAAASQEFEIPAEWLEKAAAEGAIDFSTNDAAGHVAKWLPVFQARYPEIELVATETSGAARAVVSDLQQGSGQRR